MRSNHARLIVLSLFAVPWSPVTGADNDILGHLMADRVEYVTDGNELVRDVQAWVGDDYNKLWLKSEGGSDAAELQALYSRAVSPFFDLQIGLRHDIDPQPSRSYAVIGMQGLAPYWFEIDSAVFISEMGDVSARIEVEYDLLLTQRLILQPRLEVNAGFSSIEKLNLGSGLRDTDLSLRLRYEVRRKFSPYVGLRWTQLHGATADFVDMADGDADSLSFIFGMRAWF